MELLSVRRDRLAIYVVLTVWSCPKSISFFLLLLVFVFSFTVPVDFMELTITSRSRVQEIFYAFEAQNVVCKQDHE